MSSILSCKQEIKEVDKNIDIQIEIKPKGWLKKYGKYRGPIVSKCLDEYHFEFKIIRNNVGLTIKTVRVTFGDFLVHEEFGNQRHSVDQELSVLSDQISKGVTQFYIEVEYRDGSGPDNTEHKYIETVDLNMENLASEYQICYYELGKTSDHIPIQCPLDSNMLVLCGMGDQINFQANLMCDFTSYSNEENGMGLFEVTAILSNPDLNFIDTMYGTVELDIRHLHFPGKENFNKAISNVSTPVVTNKEGFGYPKWGVFIEDYYCTTYTVDCFSDSFIEFGKKDYLGKYAKTIALVGESENYRNGCLPFSDKPNIEISKDEEDLSQIDLDLEYSDMYSIIWEGVNGYKSISRHLRSLEPGTYTYTLTNLCGETYSDDVVLNDK